MSLSASKQVTSLEHKQNIGASRFGFLHQSESLIGICSFTDAKRPKLSPRGPREPHHRSRAHLIIIDSDGLRLGAIKNARTEAFPNLELSEIIHKVKAGLLDPRNNGDSQYKNIIIHAGAEDLEEGMALDRIVFLFKAISKLIKEQSPNSDIMISSILPRVIASSYFKTSAKILNGRLADFCAREGFGLLPSFRPFLSRGRPKAEFFDGSRISAAGAASLTCCFQHALSPKNQGVLVKYAQRGLPRVYRP